jgi:hypothetical protein
MARQKSFKNMTMREKFITYFHELGYRPVDSRSKYVVLFNGTQYIFLGSSGAVRVNSRNSATGSQSYTPQFKRVMENWAAQKGYSL